VVGSTRLHFPLTALALSQVLRMGQFEYGMLSLGTGALSEWPPFPLLTTHHPPMPPQLNQWPSDSNMPAGKSAPIFSDGSILHDDGWVTTTDGLLLFWVPPENRLGLLRPSTHAIIGAPPTRLDMQRFVHGPQWTLCKTVT